MRIRVKFSKTGAMKFIGHLDVMRYFQKALRRAEIPYALSGGFSPHMLMSFAAPLGVGKTSTGEYFDLDLREEMLPEEICRRLNGQMAEGFSVLSVCQIPEEKSSKGMSQVAAADYSVIFPLQDDRKCGYEAETGTGCAEAQHESGLSRAVLRDDSYDGCPLLSPEEAGFSEDCIRRYLEQPVIEVMRKTKRKEEMTDIRPWILSVRADERAIHMRLSAGSVQNLKPELVMESLAAFAGKEGFAPFSIRINRDEILTAVPDGAGVRYLPLDAVGVQRV